MQLASEKQPLLAELAVTENISLRGARVRSRHSRAVEEHVWLRSLPGDFRCIARVAYCHRISGDEFSLGLHFFDPAGKWVINSKDGPGDPSQRTN